LREFLLIVLVSESNNSSTHILIVPLPLCMIITGYENAHYRMPITGYGVKVSSSTIPSYRCS